jgi:hypothetical protein
MSNGTLSFVIELKEKVSSELAKLKTSVASTKSAFQSSMDSMKSQFASAFTATAIVGAVRSVLAYVGQIKDASESTGIGVERFQALSAAAKQNGVDMGTLAMSVSRLRDVQASVAGNDALENTFKRIGISVDEVQNSNPEQLLQRIAQGIRSTGDSAVAFDIFGRGAAKMLSTLNELADGWDSLTAKFHQGIISETDIENIDRMGDSLDNAGITAKAFGASIIGGISAVADILGRMSTGEGLGEAGTHWADDKTADKRKREELKKQQEEAQIAARKAEQDRKHDELLKKAGVEGAAIGDQFAKSTLSDKEYETRLQEKVNQLASAANEEGLSALERQLRSNEALKASIELLELQKKIKTTEASEWEGQNDKENAEQDAKKKRLVAQSQYQYHSKFDGMSDEEKLKATEGNIATWRKNVAGATNEKDRLSATEGLIGQLQIHDELKKRITEAAGKMDEQKKGDATTRADKIKAAQENISKVGERHVSGAGLGDVFSRMYDMKKGRTPSDSAAQQTAENTKIIAENTKLLRQLGVVQ